jgi:hypothetical protein
VLCRWVHRLLETERGMDLGVWELAWEGLGDGVRLGGKDGMSYAASLMRTIMIMIMLNGD